MSYQEEENFLCPYCSSPNFLFIDYSMGSQQELIQDCETCCSPFIIELRIRGAEITSINIRKENE